ncbi:uncharacterized protein LOC113765609 [Coffea eugenioides]|uniref:uncharacterized protein LOC113765609 n=1 Tax=Coffea eugenioides TaxID=49369 RepID=UPI000F60D511|nr:uncharacterized protein LOC113765609 [Coffea eugenioides]
MQLCFLYSCLRAGHLMNGLKTCFEVFLCVKSCDHKLFSQSDGVITRLMEKMPWLMDYGESQIFYVRVVEFNTGSIHEILIRINLVSNIVLEDGNFLVIECPCLVRGTCYEKYLVKNRDMDLPIHGKAAGWILSHALQKQNSPPF